MAAEEKPCKSCEAPVDANASHVSAADCRAAQRKLIRSLRAENERLREAKREYEGMMGIPSDNGV